MRSKWSAEAARDTVSYYERQGISEDLALRVYTSRLLGNDAKLVLHGGGNTSVKTMMTDTVGDKVEVLCVKGSGWDMANIEPPGLPAVRLESIRKLRGLKKLTDEEMVNAQRGALLNSNSPNPSVETLLHAFLPHKFVDHTHSDAILSVTDQPDGTNLCREIFADRVALVPYIMPGFDLAKACASIWEKYPDVEGLILLKHGIFTFGEDARESYQRMINLVSVAENYLQSGKPAKSFTPRRQILRTAKVAEISPIVRGALAEKDGSDWRRMVLDFRDSPHVMNFVNGRDVVRYATAGPVTPDHVIRTKPKPLIIPAPKENELGIFTISISSAIRKYIVDYTRYFERNNRKQLTPKIMLDPIPRVILMPGLGLFGLGKSVSDAGVAADLAETSARVIADAERIGMYKCIPEKDIFEIEYWSLEQAKLDKMSEKPLSRHVVAVTGGGSGIGAATAAAFAGQGAEVAILDRDLEAGQELADRLGGIAVKCDVTRAASVTRAFSKICQKFGGLDILVSNAGAAWEGRIGDVDEKILRESFELNFWGHQRCAQAAVAIMKAQRTGGVLLFNTSKQAVNPGPDFGPYGLPKASTLFLCRQYALDHGVDSIRANAVNADRIRSCLLTSEMIQKRSKARGLSEEEYMSGNLLGREVTANDVAQAFVDLALSKKTTGAVLTVDGGNIAAALR
ncbi:MAG: 4-formylbenzenesulfonate dehydrogenase TsaC1/TsaC2 [Alphaproteobacteria bacterium MarineAlpha11_Bin1]|nr:MAG: 4-formylbenzenesulfonate dehydrogenase TsaC1/TsaC2 [Alphaproteobacteria bacterium MarineAlpha11_Bin1]|tara:strand:+ start:6416 stop:8464 length:2049 start_codon:yes stop_codon:yes gene_type:complete